MDAFTTLEGIAVPLDRANVDTDQIIPARYLKKVDRNSFGPDLFADWRYNPDGSPKPDFILNDARYANPQILVARDNFGCGSSREHAVWALVQAGIRCVIAPSFADIFFNNYLSNGALPIVLPGADVERLLGEISATPGYTLRVDLPAQTVTTPSGRVLTFDVDSFKKDCLVRGLDNIGWTLQFAPQIAAYEQRRATEQPWLVTIP